MKTALARVHKGRREHKRADDASAHRAIARPVALRPEVALALEHLRHAEASDECRRHSLARLACTSGQRPAEMAEMPRWLLWRRVPAKERGKKPNKVPPT